MAELTNFDEIVKRAKERAKASTLVLAAADDKHVLEAVISAKKDGIVNSILIGNKQRIVDLLTQLEETPSDYEILNSDTPKESGILAVEIAAEGKADFLMKGNMETSDLLRPLVRAESLSLGRSMSHIGIQRIDGYKKLLGNTDAAMIPAPDLRKKCDILENALQLFKGLGYEEPKVACLCCKETVDPNIPETLDARKLQELAEAGTFGSCKVIGPISYDVAMDVELAAHKGFTSDCCGNFDILLHPNIHSGNILGKCFEVTCKATMAGLIVGAKIPVVLTSRGASAEEKYHSIALAAALE